jgi:hypothetical protein
VGRRVGRVGRRVGRVGRVRGEGCGAMGCSCAAWGRGLTMSCEGLMTCGFSSTCWKGTPISCAKLLSGESVPG